MKDSIIFFSALAGGFVLYKMIGIKDNTPENTKKVIENWLRTVCKGNAEDIVSLYAPDGVLLGTIAKSMKVGQKEILGYFDMFILKKPCGYFTEINIQNFGSDYAIADGTYTFELIDKKGEIEVVPARYTFVLRRINGVWKIATHHSSAQPN